MVARRGRLCGLPERLTASLAPLATMLWPSSLLCRLPAPQRKYDPPFTPLNNHELKMCCEHGAPMDEIEKLEGKEPETNVVALRF